MSMALVRKTKRPKFKKMLLKNVPKGIIVSWYCGTCNSTHVGEVVNDYTGDTRVQIRVHKTDATTFATGYIMHIDSFNEVCTL